MSICFYKEKCVKFITIAVYIDNLNLIGTPKEFQKMVGYLKKEFKIKDFGKMILP